MRSPGEAGDAAPAARALRVRGSGGVVLHVDVLGDAGAPAVVLLHGFPELGRSWRHQVPALVASGLRVAVPDLRGYGRSDRPPRVADYDLDVLADDVAALCDAVGVERASLVGHDWGGAIAWHAAGRHAGRIERLVVLAAPHPALLLDAIARDPVQLLRSWYMLAFQVPWLPERLLASGGVRAVLRYFAGRSGALSAADVAALDAAAHGDGLRGGLHYYRAAARRLLRTRGREPIARVRAPTLVLWGGRDAILGRALTVGLERVVTGPLAVEVMEDAGHFLPLERPDEVNRRLVAFLVEEPAVEGRR